MAGNEVDDTTEREKQSKWTRASTRNSNNKCTYHGMYITVSECIACD